MRGDGRADFRWALLADRITKKLRIHSPPGVWRFWYRPIMTLLDGFVAEIRELARFGSRDQFCISRRLLPPELADDLRRFGSDPTIGGIVLIMPLPPGMNRRKVCRPYPPKRILIV